MIYKLNSVKRVISKVFTDLNLNEGDHRISDMVEYAGEAVKKIGAFPTLLTKVTGKGGLPLLEIFNYQVRLPNDLTAINQVAYSTSASGPFYPMVYASGSFDHGAPDPVLPPTDGMGMPDSALVNLAMDLYNESYTQALARINTNTVSRAQLEAILSTSNNNLNVSRDSMTSSGDYTYVVVPGYLKTALRSGYIMLSYQAVPVDSEGYPMIPDDESFEEAIYWYINMKLTYPDWKVGRIRDAVYYDARNSWNFYRKQAYASAMMPNVDQLESIKNAWLRLVPDINAHSDGFSSLAKEQVIYNQDKR